MKELIELTDSDAGTHGVGHWIPADVFADIILDGVVCYGQLSGVVTLMEYDFSAGGGDTIQVRYVSPRTHSCASRTGSNQECSCLSDTSTTFGTYSIKVLPWGDYDLVCGWSIFEADGPVVKLILNEMAKRMAMCRDSHIWDSLANNLSAPNIDVETFAVCSDSGIAGSCCTFTFNLYNSIIEVQKHMQGDAYEPDYVIMHPTVAAYLYFRDGSYSHAGLPQIKYDEKGQLVSISGMKVIECCNADTCSSNTSGDGTNINAVIIDSKRAIGEVWGKRPTFNEFYDAKCDRYEEVLWQYWGAATCDPNAIGWVSNP